MLILDACMELGPIVKLVKKGLFPIVQLGVPILLIVYGTIDLGRAVIASDEKEVKAAQSRLIKRFIYAALVFFVVTLVYVLMSVVASGDAKDSDVVSWKSCWESI